MAFPSYTGYSATGDDTGDGDIAPMILPATVGAGDLFVLIAAVDSSAGITGASDNSATSGTWTTLGLKNEANVSGGLFYKIANGDEDSTTVTVAHTGANESFALRLLHFAAADWHGTSAPESEANPWTLGADTTTTPDAPASPTASWGASDNLVVTLLVCNDDPTTVTAPSGYGSVAQVSIGTTTGAHIVTAEKQITSSSDDPGTWTITASHVKGTTLIVRGAAAASGGMGALLGTGRGLIG